MKFIIEQIAIAPMNRARAMELLRDLGACTWAHDHVTALGRVFGLAAQNEADLAYNYEMNRADGKPLEFEVLDYTKGMNWIGGTKPVVSHLGMHCTPEELEEWRTFFQARGISIAQEVETQAHTNPVIKDSRRYQYVIFHTRHILGVDLKFIVRRLIGDPKP